jgi:hypothetical protein
MNSENSVAMETIYLVLVNQTCENTPKGACVLFLIMIVSLNYKTSCFVD